ncbi:MAG: CheY-like chemotaxis protein [Paraglaciecola sp.]|jgi:CheY-like chemotaxis protein
MLCLTKLYSLKFAEDTEEKIEWQGKWKVLIVDDEPEVHEVSKLSLGDFVFQEKYLESLIAFDDKEMKEMFREHDDIAVVLLDVVM